MDLVAFDVAYGCCFGDHDEIFVYRGIRTILVKTPLRVLPNLSLIKPKMPAMLETLLAPKREPSLSCRSPDGRLITRVFAEGEEGEVKA